MDHAQTAGPVLGRALRLLVIVFVTVLLVGPRSGITAAHAASSPSSATTSVVASGLNYPRGLTVGPDGALYAALAGNGTYTHPSGPCGQSPFAGSATGGSVVKVSGSTVTTVTTNLASSYFSVLGHIGAAAVAFIGTTMYVLEEGGGCQGGVPNQPIGIYKVNSDGTTTSVADLGTYYQSHPVTTPDLSDFLPNGNPFSMTAMNGNLYVAEANHEEIDKIDPATGTITRLVDFSQEPWLGPTGITSYNGSIYFGDLTEFPVVPGSASIFKLNADGTTTKVVGGLTAVTGLAAGPDGTMYATELSAVAGGPRPNTGAVVRVSPNGTITTVATGLNFPTGLTLAPNGGLYVSNNSEAAPPGSGQILLVQAQTVIASGLNYPRGLTYGPDGALYVSFAGTGTYTKPTGPCAQSPFSGSATGAGVARVTGSTVTNVTTNLASSYFSVLGHVGAAAVAFVGGTMYVLEEGGGCQGGVPNQPSGIYKVDSDGTTTLVADLGQFYQNNPVRQPDPDDFLPSGNPFSMTAMNGSLYVAEANHEEIDKVDPSTGTITRLIDFSQDPWLGPTGITSYNGSIYFADLTEFPIVPGSAGIFRLNTDGTTTKVVSGLSAVTGLAAATDGTMYATELSVVKGGPVPGTGEVVKISPNGTITTLASGLYFPTGLAIAPNGGLVVSDYGEAAPAGSGQVVYIPTVQAQASAGPTITPSSSFTVNWTSKTPGAGMVFFGTGPGCTGLVEVATRDMGAGTTNHSVVVTGNDLPGTVGDIGIQQGQTYWYEIVMAGSSTPDNNGGTCYSVTIPDP